MTRTGRAGGRLLLLGLLGLSALPVLLATLAYLVWPPDGGRSYGELVAQPLPFHPLPGRWLLARPLAEPQCDAACRTTLQQGQRIRRAQGEDGQRLVVAGLGHQPVSGVPAGGTTLVRADWPAALQVPGLVLIDPHGNLVLRYPPDAEPERVAKEIGRVLKTNQGL